MRHHYSYTSGAHRGMGAIDVDSDLPLHAARAVMKLYALPPGAVVTIDSDEVFHYLVAAQNATTVVPL